MLVTMALIAVASLFVFRYKANSDYLFNANVEALAQVETGRPNLGHHYEVCGYLFFKFNTHQANCVRRIQVCDRDSDIGCTPETCTEHI